MECNPFYKIGNNNKSRDTSFVGWKLFGVNNKRQLGRIV